MNRILIVAAHPDDEILGCGGLIAKRVAEARIKVAFLAEGTTCRYPVERAGDPEVLRDLQTRTESATKALARLGITDVEFHNLPCGRLDQVPIIDLNKIIERTLTEFRPDTVLTHAEDDVNNDHRIVYRSVVMATRPGGLVHIPNLLTFETQSSTEWNFASPFAPNYFEELTAAQVATKWDALACYTTEVREYPHPRSREGIEVLARYRGMQAGVEYAEALRIVRMIVP
jgi:LmbE family N-acetylglucosaminyl deacetylase